MRNCWNGVLVQPAPRQVFAGLRALGAAQAFLEKCRARSWTSSSTVRSLASFGFLRSVEAGLGHGDPQLLGHRADGFREGDVLDFLDEGENVAGDAAAEAVKELAGGVDRERRRLFAVKGTKPGIVLRTRLLQLDVVADDADDVRLLLDVFFEVVGFGHGWRHSYPQEVEAKAADLNIPEAECCGEAVGGEDSPVNASGKVQPIERQSKPKLKKGFTFQGLRVDQTFPKGS